MTDASALRMQTLASPRGRAALAALVQHRALLAFDFDGTLSPIVTHPNDARTPPEIAAAMERLCRHATVAVVTGRAVADAAPRLGFTPRYLVGNHGAEGLDAMLDEAQSTTLELWRAWLREKWLVPFASHGVTLEDKGRSFTLHYRQAPDQELALGVIETALAELQPPPEILGGKCVVNLLPPGARDKFSATEALLARSGCETVFFVGDDTTDERVFEQAPASWLTVRVGYREDSAARFFIAQQEEVVLWVTLLAGLYEQQGGLNEKPPGD